LSILQRRTNRITVRVSNSELRRMKAKMEEVGTANMSLYMRKMILNGYCVRMDTTEVRELVYLLRMCSKM